MKTDIVKAASDRLAKARANLRKCRPGTEAHSIALREYTSAVKEARVAGCAAGCAKAPNKGKSEKKDYRRMMMKADGGEKQRD